MVRVLLKIPEKVTDQAITSQVILEQGVPLNILIAKINQQGGEILVEIPSTHADKVADAFRRRGVDVVIRNLIEVDDERCIDCGSCISLCPVDAITLEEDKSVVFNREKCVGSACGLCVNACPTRAIKLVKPEKENNRVAVSSQIVNHTRYPQGLS